MSVRSYHARNSDDSWSSNKTKIVYLFKASFYSNWNGIGSSIVSAMRSFSKRYDAKQDEYTGEKSISKFMYPYRNQDGEWVMLNEEEYQELGRKYVEQLRERNRIAEEEHGKLFGVQS